MSGPFPPPGYPRQPDQGGWPGGAPHGPGPGGQYGPRGYPGQHQSQPQYGSPPGPGYGGTPDYGSTPEYGGAPHYGGTPEYGGVPEYGGRPGPEYGGAPEYGGRSGPEYVGLTGTGGWGEGPGKPPPKRRHVLRTIIGVVSVLVIVGGVATGTVLLVNRHHEAARTAPPAPASTAPSAAGGSGGSSGASGSAGSGGSGDATVIAGRTQESLTQGSCVTATVDSAGQYDVGARTACGQADSDLLLAKVSGTEDGCAAHQYLLVEGPGKYYCFTLDVKQGDCLDRDYLKSPCTSAAYTVLATEPGPGSSNSCKDQATATHWVPVGPDPVSVACLAPTTPH